MNFDEFKNKQLNKQNVKDEYDRLVWIYDMVTALGGPNMCSHIPTDETVEIASALAISSSCCGTDIVDSDITLKDNYVDLYLLVKLIAYRLAIGDLKLIEVADKGGKKPYYDKLIEAARNSIIRTATDCKQDSSKMKYKAINIQWDVDGPNDLEHLPTVIDIPANIHEDDIADYISDLTGFCHKGFELVEL